MGVIYVEEKKSRWRVKLKAADNCEKALNWGDNNKSKSWKDALKMIAEHT